MITVFMNNKGVGGGREPFQSITNFTPEVLVIPRELTWSHREKWV